MCCPSLFRSLWHPGIKLQPLLISKTPLWLTPDLGHKPVRLVLFVSCCTLPTNHRWWSFIFVMVPEILQQTLSQKGSTKTANQPCTYGVNVMDFQGDFTQQGAMCWHCVAVTDLKRLILKSVDNLALQIWVYKLKSAHTDKHQADLISSESLKQQRIRRSTWEKKNPKQSNKHMRGKKQQKTQKK